MKYTSTFLTAVLLIMSISGCSLFNDQKEIAQVKFRLENSSESEEQIPVVIDFVSEENSKTISSSDFSTKNLSMGPFRVSTYGKLSVSAQLVNPKKEPVVTNTIELPLHSDLEYSITVSIGNSNPINTCFGCVGSKPVSLESILNFATTDSLYIVWGKNSIKNPVYF